MPSRALLVVEIGSITFLAKTIWSVAGLTSREVRAVWGGQAPQTAAAAILHEIRLAQYKSHFILVGSPQVGQVIVWDSTAIWIAGVPWQKALSQVGKSFGSPCNTHKKLSRRPVIEAVGEGPPRMCLVKPRGALPDLAVTLIRFHVPELMNVPRCPNKAATCKQLPTPEGTSCFHTIPLVQVAARELKVPCRREARCYSLRRAGTSSEPAAQRTSRHLMNS